MSHLPYPKYFSLPAWWKHIRELPAMAKNQNYWGDVSPPPRDLQPCFQTGGYEVIGEIGIRDCLIFIYFEGRTIMTGAQIASLLVIIRQLNPRRTKAFYAQ